MHTMKESHWTSCTAVCTNAEGNVILTGTTSYVGSSKVQLPSITCWRLMWNPPPKQQHLTRTQTMKIQKVLHDFASEGTVNCLTFCSDQIRALSSTSDYQIRIWNFGGGPKMGTLEMRYAGQPQEISRLGSSDGGVDGMLNVWAEGKDGSFRKWNRRTGIRLVDKAGGASRFTTLACCLICREGQQLNALILDSSRRISCWNLIDDAMESDDVLDPEKEDTFCSLACWSKECMDGKMILVWSKQKRVYMCEVNVQDTMKQKRKRRERHSDSIYSLVGMSDAVSSLAVSENGKHIVAGSHEGEILWWDLSEEQTKEKKKKKRIEPTRRIREINTESNGTVQHVHISKDNKRCSIVTWDEFFVYQFKGGRILGKRPIDDFFVSHSMCLDNGAVLLIGDDRPRLWTLIPDEESMEENESKASALRRWKKIKEQVRDNIKIYDGYAAAFAPKLSDECSSIAVNEPSQSMFVVGFCDGGLCAWRRSSVQIFAKTTLPGGLPITALCVNSDGSKVFALCGTMAYCVRLGRPKCETLMKIPVKTWRPTTKPTFLTRQINSVTLHTTNSNDTKREEIFYHDRGDRVDAWNIIDDSMESKLVVALGTKEGRVHILRRGGKIEIDEQHAYVEPPPPPKKEILDLSLTDLLLSYHPEEKSMLQKQQQQQHASQVYVSSRNDLEKGERPTTTNTINTTNTMASSIMIGPDGDVLSKREATWWQKGHVFFTYYAIGLLRRHALTIWPYNHGFPGVSKGVRPNRWRRLQKMQAKRNLLLMQLYVLLVSAMLLVVAWLLVLVLFVLLLPPVRVISKLEARVYVNNSNGTNGTATSAAEIKCYDRATITNQTNLWRLGNMSKLCECLDYEKEKTCSVSTGFAECEWDEENEECIDFVQKTCVDVPPSAGESCSMYKGFGKCSADFMVGFCCETCFQCEC